MTKTVLINIRNYVYWIRALLIFVLTEQKDFVALTPPPLVSGPDIHVFRRQRVFHKRTRRSFTVPLHNTIEYYTFVNMFGYEFYRLGQLARRNEIGAFYQSQQLGGKTPLIVDCGSNVGLSLLYFAFQYPHARIIGVEPDAGNFAKSVALTRQHPSVQVINAGIASAEGFASLVNTGKGNDAFRTEVSEAGGVRLVSVEGILRQQDDAVVPFLIKIDIEGFEQNLFEKNVGWIDRFPVLVVELHDWLFPAQGTSRNFLTAIAGRERDFVHYGENFYSIRHQI
jgi:FkbM family methyltransferase